ncbi:mobile mystery protein B [bacterium]|nr:MAG: mobile mystery protein B [bacterium]
MIEPFRAPEGSTPIDAAGLRSRHVTTYADLCVAEAENILAAQAKHLTRRASPEKVLTEEFLRRLHRDMFGAVWDWAGTYRRVQTNVGVAPAAIREEAAKLCQDARFWDAADDGMPVLERAVRLHHRCVWIHPFPNGNGRHARMLADVYLFSHRHALPAWPSGLAGAGAARADYLAALKAADAGDHQGLVAFTRRFLPD